MTKLIHQSRSREIARLKKQLRLAIADETAAQNLARRGGGVAKLEGARARVRKTQAKIARLQQLC